jgi:Xaa-Pro aminopeptidase
MDWDIKAELSLRWRKIQAMLQLQAVDACLLSTNVNIYYTTGILISGFVYLPCEGNPLFFVRRPVDVEGENVVHIRKPEEIPFLLKEKGYPTPKVLMLEGGEITHTDFLRLQAAMNVHNIIDGTPLLRQVRSVKTAYEITQIKESACLQSEAFNKFPSLYRSGMTDHDFTVEMERCMRQYGNLGMFRVFGSTMEAGQASVLAGHNAEVPSAYDFALGGKGVHPSLPIGHSGVMLAQGIAVMVDFGGNFNGYVSDMTRVYSIGKLSQKAYDAHQVSLEIQQTLAEKAIPGAICEDLYHISLRIAKKYRFSDCFMGISQQAKFVGHGVGLVVNELPVLCDKNKDTLQVNMTIAIEPKFIIPGVGAVGTENTFVVNERGLEKITTAPEQIIDLTGNKD